jgi:hypothetical protein
VPLSLKLGLERGFSGQSSNQQILQINRLLSPNLGLEGIRQSRRQCLWAGEPRAIAGSGSIAGPQS